MVNNPGTFFDGYSLAFAPADVCMITLGAALMLFTLAYLYHKMDPNRNRDKPPLQHQSSLILLICILLLPVNREVN